jgi:AcrR family transcriptional regulator
MGAVAQRAGVATGTAYTHYASKDELVLAAYLETKARLAKAATADLDPDAPAAERFQALWLATYRHLARHRDDARFLLQVESSPYRNAAHEAGTAVSDDPLMAEAAEPDIAAQLIAVPLDVIYDLSLGPAVRLAASGEKVTDAEIATIAAACWRAITR